MANIFEYRPELKYVLADINAIDNLPATHFEAVKPYLRHTVSQALTKLAGTKTSLTAVRNTANLRLRNISIPFNKELLDELTSSKLTNFQDSSKLINDGYLTFDLYKQIVDNPEFQLIVDMWDEYHSGINGNLVAELYPYIDIVEDSISNIDMIISDTFIYRIDSNEDIDTIDLNEIKTVELLDIEDYMKLLDDFDDAKVEDLDLAEIIQRQLDQVENTIYYRKNISRTLDDTIAGLDNILLTISDIISPEANLMLDRIVTETVSDIIKVTGLVNSYLKVIVYSSFRELCKTVTNAKLNQKNTLPKNVKDVITKNTIKCIRAFLDVGVPGLISLSYSTAGQSVAGPMKLLLSGLQQITTNYEDSLLSLKNMMQSDIYKTILSIGQINDKHMARSVYKAF